MAGKKRREASSDVELRMLAAYSLARMLSSVHRARLRLDLPLLPLGSRHSTGRLTARVPKGTFPPAVLKDAGYAIDEVPLDNMRFGGEGLWVAISRDPKTGLLRAASHNRNNSGAVAR